MKTFDELELLTPIQRALSTEGYQRPTPIQARTIPAAIAGRDVLGCAQTGTGKTAAFAIPILQQLGEQRLRPIPNRPVALILSPTRELAIQIDESFSTYGRHLKLRTALVYGGVNQDKQVRALNRGAHILVATPGRLLDLMNQGHVSLDRLQIFVLDEADRMLDMGFLPDLKRIIRALPRQRQSLFFSATLPPKIMDLAHRLLKDPVSVDVTPKTTSVERIDQRVMLVENRQKTAMLTQVLRDDKVERMIVFTRTKRGANQLTARLIDRDIQAAAIHGNKSQNARQKALLAFRNGEIRVLVATDVAARGIDIDGVTHVVNYDLPAEPESYVHRIGRTGRAGATGIAVTFCSQSDRPYLKAIEKLIDQRIAVTRTESSPASPASTEKRGSKATSETPGRRTRRPDPGDRTARSETGAASRRRRRSSSRSRRRSKSPAGTAAGS